MSTAGQKFPVTFQGISIFFRGMPKYFTSSTIYRRTPNNVLQDSKVQRNPVKITMELAVFMLHGRGSLAEGHIICRLCHLPCFNQGRQERVWAQVTIFFRAPRARVDSLQIFTLNRKDKL